MQFLYVIRGKINIEFSPDETSGRTQDAGMIPGGTIYMKLGGADGVEVLELTVPAEIATENVASPRGDVRVDFDRTRGVVRNPAGRRRATLIIQKRRD